MEIEIDNINKSYKLDIGKLRIKKDILKTYLNENYNAELSINIRYRDVNSCKVGDFPIRGTQAELVVEANTSYDNIISIKSELRKLPMVLDVEYIRDIIVIFDSKIMVSLI